MACLDFLTMCWQQTGFCSSSTSLCYVSWTQSLILKPDLYFVTWWCRLPKIDTSMFTTRASTLDVHKIGCYFRRSIKVRMLFIANEGRRLLWKFGPCVCLSMCHTSQSSWCQNRSGAQDCRWCDIMLTRRFGTDQTQQLASLARDRQTDTYRRFWQYQVFAMSE